MTHRTAGSHAAIDHVELYVGDAAARSGEFVQRYGFHVAGRRHAADHESVVLRRGHITLVVTQGTADDHPASAYVLQHGDGVATIALRVPDAAAATADALAAGAERLREGIAGFGDVAHVFVDGPAGPAGPADSDEPAPPGLTDIDHVAVCLESGTLADTVAHYERAFGWQQIFEENIHVGAQAMQSKVVQSRSGEVTITLLQPLPGAQPGQIDDFLKNHGGSGVQHLAFSVPDILRAVDELGERGVRFLSTPGPYYQELAGRLDHPAHPVSALRSRGILADQDHDGQLFQIFTRSEHPRGTLFMELIERQGATTFGSNNIRKLYEAVERATRDA
ncbi:4-hydroxyphenylpyruvate dioxygenase [Acrocarpospora catenulata]|uniref:4-hydroxyphenylpyruvate dioxygenase n=1 Tax=Acrocarpospora catenulata TaxID=2836182 RepID=UPI001BD9D9BA|nr:4-hydroxyphenylpyruvate dioxygenase [Acrocarpospora catenulata]